MALWPQMLNMIRRAQNRLCPFPMPFAPSPTDVREWPVEVQPAGTNVPIPFGNGVLQVSLHRILIEAGIALTPATTVWDPRAWFALYRYGPSFLGSAPDLRLFAGAQNLDPRITGVLAEEVACGITCYVLREHFGLDHIADVYPLIQSKDLVYVSAAKSRPDYFCLDNNMSAVLAESKGAVGTRRRVEKQVAGKGWDQVTNVAPTKHALRQSCGRLVLGTNFCISGLHAKSETTTIIKDPDGRNADGQDASDNPLRVAYAKAMRFAGLDILADALLLRESPPPLDFQPIEIGNFLFRVLGLSPFGGLVCILNDILIAIVNASVVPLTESVPNALQGFREDRERLPGGYALPNGFMILYLNGAESTL